MFTYQENKKVARKDNVLACLRSSASKCTLRFPFLLQILKKGQEKKKEKEKGPTCVDFLQFIIKNFVS